VVPRSVPHAVANLSDEPVRFITVVTPSGIEDSSEPNATTWHRTALTNRSIPPRSARSPVLSRGRSWDHRSLKHITWHSTDGKARAQLPPQACSRRTSSIAIAIRVFALVARISINLASHRACARLFYSLERKVLWLAPEQIADRGEPDVAELVSGYKRLFLETQFNGGDDADRKVIVVVITDLPADRAQVVFDDVLQHLAVPSYAGRRRLSGAGV
jgi:hypothetical protein